MTSFGRSAVESRGPAWRLGDFLSGKNRLWLFFLVFAVSFAVRCAAMVATKSYLGPERTEVVSIAISLANHGTFANAYLGKSGATAHAAPLYPFVLSFIYQFLGAGVEAELGQELMSISVASLQYGLLAVLAPVFGFSIATGFLAGMTGALLPLNFWSENKGSFEATFTAVFLLLLAALTMVLWRKPKLSDADSLRWGLLAALAILCAPSVIPVVAALLILQRWQGADRARYLRFACGSIAVIGVLLAPWIIRNRVVMGAWLFSLRSNFGLELRISNNDEAGPTYHDNTTGSLVLQRLHPFTNDAQRNRLMEIGEVAFHQQMLEEAKDWIWSHPGRFARLTAERVVLFWLPTMVRWPQEILYRALSLFGLAGLTLLIIRRRRAAWLFSAIFLSYSAAYYFVQVFARYRHPLDWAMWMLAAYFVVAMATRQAQSRPAEVDL